MKIYVILQVIYGKSNGSLQNHNVLNFDVQKIKVYSIQFVDPVNVVPWIKVTKKSLKGNEVVVETFPLCKQSCSQILITYVLNFYPPKFCFKILISYLEF